MKRTIHIGALAVFASLLAAGCAHHERTVVRRETVQAPAVVERRTTVETVPAPVVERTTTHSESVERSHTAD